MSVQSMAWSPCQLDDDDDDEHSEVEIIIPQSVIKKEITTKGHHKHFMLLWTKQSLD